MERLRFASVLCVLLAAAGCGSEREEAPASVDVEPADEPQAAEPAKTAARADDRPSAALETQFTKIPPEQIDEARRKAAEDFARSYEVSRKAGKFAPLGEEVTDEMREGLTPERQKQSHEAITAQVGDFESLEFVEALHPKADDTATIFRFRGKFTKDKPEIRVVHDAAGKVGGYWIRPWRDSLERPRPEKIDPGQVSAKQRDAAAAFAHGYLESRKAGKFEPLGDEVTDTMREALTPQRQQQAFEAVTAQVGEFQSMAFVEAQRLIGEPGTVIYRFRGTFTRNRPEIRVVYDAAGKVSGLWISPWSDVMR